MRLKILHKLPTPYNDMFFRAIHNEEHINLNVYHLWRGNWRRPWKSELGIGYRNEYLSLKYGLDWDLLKNAWKSQNDFFLVADWGHLVSLVVILVRLIRKSPVGIWADTPQEDAPRPLLKRKLRRLFLRFLLPRLDVIFATGKPGMRVLSELGAKQNQLVNLPCFVDLEHPEKALNHFEVKAYSNRLRKLVGCDNRGIVFSMIGTLMHIKGQDIGLRAFAECKKACRQHIGLLIAGDGPERENLERLANSLSIQDSVAFLGWQEPTQMDSIYLASNVIIHPARQDPFPLVVMETMSWSRVIVGSDVCGSIQDRVIHGLNGYSFKSEDISSLAEILIYLINHPKQITDVGNEARKCAEKWPVSHGVNILMREAEKSILNKS